jgi:hypothetical protein
MNIAYYLSPDDISLVSSLCEQWITSVAKSNDDTETIPLIDIGLVCAQIFAQKNESHYADSPLRTVYPFMDDEMVDLALHHSRYWPGNRIPKNTLKHMLSKSISPELIYREKRGFLGPVKETFSHPIFLKHLDNVSNSDSPLYDFLNHRLLNNMKDYLVKRKELSHQTYNFLWMITFANTWLSQLDRISLESN